LSKIVVIGGSTDDTETNSVEILDLSGEGHTCATLPDYPLAVTHLTATFLNDELLACGGWEPAYDKCFKLTADNLSEWVEISSLIEPLSSMASSNVDGKWLISGGTTPISKYSYRTSIYNGQHFSRAKDLPYDKRRHCQLTVDDNHVLFTGGHKPDSYLMDWDRQRYVVLWDVPTSSDLSYAVCGVLNNPMYGREVLLATGEESYLYSFADSNWKEGLLLPEGIMNSSSAQINKGVVSIGGAISGKVTKQVYLFDEETYKWQLLSQKLKQARKGAAAVPVPDHFLNC